MVKMFALCLLLAFTNDYIDYDDQLSIATVFL